MNTKSIGRNDPCPCGSGKKYKQCCQLKEVAQTTKHNQINIKKLLQEAKINQTNGDTLNAIECYKQILNQYPKHAESLYETGQLYIGVGKYEIAINYFLKGIKEEPSAVMYCSLADAFIATQQMTKAHECYIKAIKLNPGDSLIYNNFGAFLLREQNYTEAEKVLSKAISLNKNSFLAFSNLNSIYLIYGKYKEAIESIKQAIKLTPSIRSYFNLLFSLCFDKELFKEIYLQEAKNLESILLKNVSPYHQNINYIIHSDICNLKVGFVSGDLRVHPVAHFLESTLKELSKSKKLKLVAYYTQHYEDYKTSELKPLFENWHNIASLTSIQAADKIYNDDIDILIDLAGYTAQTGIEIFAWHPAKIQISWLGYYASTGLKFLDYFLADPISIDTKNMHFFTEHIWHLPNTRLCFSEPDEGNITITPPPITTNGYVTFGCFQNITKISDHIIRIWSNILTQSPNSKLLIKNTAIKDQNIKEKLISRFGVYGILEDQLIFDIDSKRAEYFKSYNKVDFLLDTFPYPGGTTTCEALWMGVPTLTLTGETLLERQGHSLLNAAGLTNWVCFNENEYIQKAIDFSQDINYLTTLRNNLRNQTLNSPLMNAQLFAKNLEQALFDIWEHHHKIKI